MKEQQRLISHNALKLTKKMMEDKIKKRTNKDFKLAIMATHDIMLVAMLKQLGAYTTHPDVASTLIFELHQYGPDDFFVQTIYNNKTLRVGGCNEQCLYKSFKLLLDNKTYKYSDKFMFE
jgi:hypothetical protein